MKKLFLALAPLFSLNFFSPNLFAADKSLYDFKWLDEGETVYVVQNKEYIKAKSFSLDLSYLTSDSSPYQDTTGFSATITYYLTENFSLDYTYKSYNNEDNSDLDNLREATTPSVKPIIRKIDSAQLIHFNWIPFYGKINTFNRIFFFDWGLGLGVGSFETQGNYKTFSQSNIPLTYEKSTDSGFNIRSYFKFFTKAHMTFGFEYNLSGVNTIKDPDGKEELLWYTDILATVGYLF